MPKRPALVTAAEIARFAGVTRATVSNWRRRHADFPAPAGGTDSSPAYDLEAVRMWLATRSHRTPDSPADMLRTALLDHVADRSSDGHVAGLLSLVPVVARLGKPDFERLAVVSDTELRQRLLDAARSDLDQDLGIVREATRCPSRLLRALIECVKALGGVRTLDVLAERLREDGAYATPAPLADLMAAFLIGTDGAAPTRVLDPACGSGGLLAAAARAGAKELLGQEIAPTQTVQTRARLRLVAHDLHCQIRVGDSLRIDAFPDLAADAVVCNPPYGVRDWGHDELAYDPRWAYGLPPRAESDLAWVQHCLAHLEPGGIAVLLMPPGAAERVSGRRIRAELIRSGALRALLALPAGVAPPLHVGLHLWILTKPSAVRTDALPILLVDSAAAGATASSGPAPGHVDPTGTSSGRASTNWQILRDTLLIQWQTFAGAPQEFESVPGLARSRPVVDLLDEAVDLTPARHVYTSRVTDEPEHHAATSQAVRTFLRRAGHALVALSGGPGWAPAGVEPLSWRSATVADLLRGGAVELRRAGLPPRTTRATVPDREPLNTQERVVLTARDVAAGRPPSRQLSQEQVVEYIEVRKGDVVLPELLANRATGIGDGGVGSARRSVTARVIGDGEAGAMLGPHLFLLRPDPTRIDPWFLAGFLSAEENLQSATSGASVVRVDARRLRVPLLPLDRQRDYGRAFRRLLAIRTAADLAMRLADEAVLELAAGLTSGSLLPPETDPP